MADVTWVLEECVFPQSHQAIREAIRAAQCEVLLWNDEWLADRPYPELRDRAVVFHGSLENAAVIRSQFPWQPGAYCDTERLRCSAWYPQASGLLVHEHWKILPANELVASARTVADSLGAGDALFVRPDSPLKPFSGRVVPISALTLRALDFGFYFEDETLPVVVAPVRQISREWRYVVADRVVVAGSVYQAANRRGLPDSPRGEAWHFAQQVAQSLPPPEAAYVLDICESGGRLHVLELNPLSGADLYACDRLLVVEAVSNLARAAIAGQSVER